VIFQHRNILTYRGMSHVIRLLNDFIASKLRTFKFKIIAMFCSFQLGESLKVLENGKFEFSAVNTGLGN